MVKLILMVWALAMGVHGHDLPCSVAFVLGLWLKALCKKGETNGIWNLGGYLDYRETRIHLFLARDTTSDTAPDQR